MSADSMRRAAAVLLLILGGAALWWAGSGAQASAPANDAMVATIAAVREHAAPSDPRLKSRGRSRHGWLSARVSAGAGN